VTGYLAIAGLVLAAAVGAPYWGAPEQSTFSGMIVLDSFSLTIGWIFLLIAAITIAISLDYLPRQGIEQGEYYPLVLFATAGMLLLAQGNSLIVLFLGLELLSITLYILAGFAYPRVTSEEAAMKYLLLGAFAAGFFVYGMALIYGQTGSVQLFSYAAEQSSVAQYLGRQTLAAESLTLLYVGTGLVLVAFGFKTSLAPFHMWTPDVYEGSPTPVAALMSAGSKGAGFAAMLRLLLVALPSQRAVWLPVLAALAAITMVVGSVGALRQLNVKRMLAYSSIAHAGYLALGVLAGTALGVQSFLFYLLAYALTNLGAFAVLIALEQRGESAWSLSDLAGLWNRPDASGNSRLLAAAMAIFMLSLAGVPPMAGFMAKFYVFGAALDAGLWWLALIGVLTSAISAFFYLRVIVSMFMQEPVRDVQPIPSRGLTIGLGVAAVATLLIGLIPAPVVELVRSALLVASR
jgi:NADH-quinone oxidoreductase subunit N